jgi:GNAT superfamily N-acetyltransferase
MSTVQITQERPDRPEATALVLELEDHLAPQYPVESRHGLSIERLINEGVAFFVVWVDGAAAGCGGVKLFGSEYGELKRMYVRPAFRGQGLAQQLLAHLATYAQAQGVTLLRLETGIYQTDAIRLYERAGYQPIGPFGAYQPDPLSLFYEKHL